MNLESTTSNPIIPSFHKPVPMGTRVLIPEHYIGKANVTGVVSGISSVHVSFVYIIILDEEIDTVYGPQRAIAVLGTELRGVNGEDWRIYH